MIFFAVSVPPAVEPVRVEHPVINTISQPEPGAVEFVSSAFPLPNERYATPLHPPTNIDEVARSPEFSQSIPLYAPDLSLSPAPEASPSAPEILSVSSSSEQTDTTEAPANPISSSSPVVTLPPEFELLLVGITVNGSSTITSTMIRAQEDGTQAVNLKQWLIPYDTVVEALKLNVTLMPDRSLEVKFGSRTTRLLLEDLATDPQLGLVFSVAQLQSLWDIEVQFDLNDYALKMQAPWLNRNSPSLLAPTSVVVDNLPAISPDAVSLSAVEQRINVREDGDRTPSAQGNLSAVGSFFGGSWFIRTEQQELLNLSTWRLAEARYQRQTENSDYILGSQPPFWPSPDRRDYWGLTAIQRQGFIPQQQLFGNSDPRLRLQAAQMNRTIEGQAEPGTLVRLVQGFSDRILGEVLVDSSGIYRFENVPSDPQAFNSYRLFLYDQGRLTDTPEIREATFSSLPGQLPGGSSVWVASVGARRDRPTSFTEAGESSSNSTLGNFTELSGGIAHRWGVTDELTLGAGAVYDQSLRGLGEFFFQPSGIPLKAAVSVLTGAPDQDWDVNALVSFDPSPNFSARLTSNQFSTRLNTHWQVVPGITLLGSADSREGSAAGGVQFLLSGHDFFTLARATLDTQGRFRWNALQRLGPWNLESFGNEVGSNNELTYDFSPDTSNGHVLALGYQNRWQSQSDRLMTLLWRYRSESSQRDRRPLWEVELGYGIGSQGSGAIASVGTRLIPGLSLRGRYQGVSLTTGEDSLSLELVSNLNFFQGTGPQPGDRHLEDLRTQGGLVVQPFFDRNLNGQRDANEGIYTDPHLLLLNHQSLARLTSDPAGLVTYLPPGVYRLDLDPAGFPLDWQAAVDAYAVEVVSGSYTTVNVPLIPAYTLSGIVSDDQGQPLSGARVEAFASNGNIQSFSVTNEAGVYYLERLPPGRYTLQVNGQTLDMIEFQELADSFQELNLQPNILETLRFNTQI